MNVTMPLEKVQNHMIPNPYKPLLHIFPTLHFLSSQTPNFFSSKYFTVTFTNHDEEGEQATYHQLLFLHILSHNPHIFSCQLFQRESSSASMEPSSKSESSMASWTTHLCLLLFGVHLRIMIWVVVLCKSEMTLVGGLEPIFGTTRDLFVL